MLPVLVLLPAVTSLALGLLYLLDAGGRPPLRILAAAVFLAAVQLQFFSPYPLAGLLLQTGLALCLAVRRKRATPA